MWWVIINCIILLPILYSWCKGRIQLPFILGFVFLSSSLFHIAYNESSITQHDCRGWCVVYDSYEVTVFGTFFLLWVIKLGYECCVGKTCCKKCIMMIPPMLYFVFCTTQLFLSVLLNQFSPASKHLYDIGGVVVSLVWCLEGRGKNPKLSRIQNV